MMIAKNYDELVKLIKMNGGVINVSMGDLRDINGSDRLGVNVVGSIKDQLVQRGIAHSAMETAHWKRVRLYLMGTAIEKVINAASEISDDADEALRQFANDELAKALRAVKNAVCDLKI